MKEQLTTVEKLTQFVNQKPGLDFANYGDSKSYNAESREITKDRNDYFELLSLFLTRYEGEANEVLTTYLSNSDRLILKNGKIEYTTGQYWCTEYRPAANRVLASLIWTSFKDEKNSQLSPVYADGHAIRAAIGRRMSKRVCKLYFN